MNTFTDRLYLGYRIESDGHTVVMVDRHILKPAMSLSVRRHSPTGFNWGYAGSGPAQLALAILIYEFGADLDLACEFYQDFKRAFVARWGTEWRLTSAEIRAWHAAQADARDRYVAGEGPVPL